MLTRLTYTSGSIKNKWIKASNWKLWIFLTVSIGVVYSKDNMNVDLANMLQVADKALYEAKNNGKNQAVITAIW